MLDVHAYILVRHAQVKRGVLFALFGPQLAPGLQKATSYGQIARMHRKGCGLERALLERGLFLKLAFCVRFAARGTAAGDRL